MAYSNNKYVNSFNVTIYRIILYDEKQEMVKFIPKFHNLPRFLLALVWNSWYGGPDPNLSSVLLISSADISSRFVFDEYSSSKFLDMVTRSLNHIRNNWKGGNQYYSQFTGCILTRVFL